MKRYSLVTNIICGLMIIGFGVFLICVWKTIPDIVPTHFDAKGVANDFGSKNQLLVLMGITVGEFGLLALIEHFPSLWNMPVEINKYNKARIYLITSYMMGTIKVLLVLIMMAGMLSSICLYFPIWVMYILCGLIIAVIIAGIIACIIYR